jgi:integrase
MKRKRSPTSKINFTKRSLEAIRPKPGERTIVYDSQVKGLGCVTQPSGSQSFFWFRRVGGQPKWETIGPFPDITIEQARNFAQEKNSRLANWKASHYEGADPFAVRAEITFGELVADYIRRHLAVSAKSPGKASDYCRWQVDRYLAHWRSRKLHSIRREDCRALHADIGETAPIMANRILQLVRTVYNFAKREELFAAENLAAGIRPFKEQSRSRFLQPAELQRLFEALDSRKTPRDLRDFVLLSLFCGARKSDTMSMRWDQLDLERGVWHVPSPKNQVPYDVPLVDAAVEILKRRPKHSEFVFPSVTSASGHLEDVKRNWQELLARAEITDLKVHDLRRSYGSYQAALGSSLLVIGRSLGHSSTEATQVYSRLQLDPIRQSVSAAVETMLTAAKQKPAPKKPRLLKP